jgi:hypothetical protein
MRLSLRKIVVAALIIGASVFVLLQTAVPVIAPSMRALTIKDPGKNTQGLSGGSLPGDQTIYEANRIKVGVKVSVCTWG